MRELDLAAYCAAKTDDYGQPAPVCDAILALADSAIQIAQLAASNGIGGKALGSLSGGMNEDGDAQKQLDVLCDAIITKALRGAGVGTYFSEEQAEPIGLNKDALIAVACDPLDGSSNIDTNLTIGTIFSVFAMADCVGGLPPMGHKQMAAGMFVYGPQTALLLSFGDEVAAFALTPEGRFCALTWDVSIPKASTEFAINASNAAFWPAPIQSYIQHVSAGAGATTSAMRWLGSLVADAYRIFRRGGIFLYPQDSRKGYEQGRLRLIYEANPVAFLVEAAGGKASSGTHDILKISPQNLHQRVPFIFGSADEVDALITLIRNS